ncbi:MAG: Ketoacyl reductase hetN [Verrucomicrobiaceae bacterium]|nr:Ketoacyl reductase hetN [Verrucomicrobiaceae bacterium]
MKIDSSTRILLTGASGGIGTHLCKVLARTGAHLMLVANPGVDLRIVQKRVIELGGKADYLVADLRTDEGITSTVDETLRALGGIDLLINNAGIEYTIAYHELPEQDMLDVMNVNLIAAMRLTRRLLPSMLGQKKGHIVCMSSLAGRAAPAYQEPYAASKAGLVAFTYSLRATYRGSGVSASVICPGFVDTGIYQRLCEKTGMKAPSLLGSSKVEAVGRALLRAIASDIPDVLVNPIPVRPLLALAQLFPKLGEKLIIATGGHEFFRRVAERLKTN